MHPSTRPSALLFLLTFALVFYGMGAAFVEGFVNYPTWPLVGAGEFRAFHGAVGALVVRYMVVPMLVTTVLTMALLWRRPAPVPRWALWLSVALQLATWVSTAAVQLPIQFQLNADGVSLPLIERLIVTNWWFRRVPHLVNATLFLWMMHLLVRGSAGTTCSGCETASKPEHSSSGVVERTTSSMTSAPGSRPVACCSFERRRTRTLRAYHP